MQNENTIQAVKPGALGPLKTLRCCCCGGYTKGRQFHNQDEGFGLGSCCVEFVRPRVDDMERTYGIEGVHYLLPVARGSL